ncbi:hypothetical protein [Kitasatospora indigofera]|uniref:hypothetical protein n=1 Tax=Kitasatospora indigofera TaxID=67307 RepID=UPI0033AADDDA
MGEELVRDMDRVYREGYDAYEGTLFDVRVVVAGMPRDVKDGFRLDDVPWERFLLGHGTDGEASAKRWLTQARSGDARAADHAPVMLSGLMAHQTSVYATAPLAVPFLLRLAADPSAHGRAHAFGLVTGVARRQHWGLGNRDAFLRTARPGLWVGCDGYAMHWAIEASRHAVTTDTDLLLGLLHDPDPQIRAQACYTLATASGNADRITSALRTRLATEKAPGVRASLVLAVAELAREHADPLAAAWFEALWSDPGRPADVRVPAALAWLCLTDDPVPDNLSATVDALDTDDLARVLDDVTWFRHVNDENGLTDTLGQMLDRAEPATNFDPPFQGPPPAVRCAFRALRGQLTAPPSPRAGPSLPGAGRS